MIERLTIARLGHRGDGVADSPHGPLYVPFCLPGETVEVDAGAGPPERRQMLRVEAASPERTDPVCAHFGICGGCALQHWRTDRYREWKRGLVVSALAVVGLDTPVDPLIDAHGEGRRRAVFHARRGAGNKLRVGFASAGSHDIVAIDHCPVLAPSLAGALPAAREIAGALDPVGKPLDLQATVTDVGIDMDVRGSGPLTAETIAALGTIATNRKLARLTRHGELILQRAAPTLRIGKAAVALPPGAFLQATREGEAALAHLVAEGASEARSIADLFTGIGPFALRLAERVPVLAVDASEAAIAALERASTAPGLRPIATQCRDLFRRPLTGQELSTFDAVVFDPPRQGAQAQAREIAASKVPIVISISCNPATFARDAKILAAGGYALTRVSPVDQFRYSAHVEIVARFVRGG